MRGWTIPRLVETKHIKHEAICASETALFFVVSNIFHQPFGFAPEGLFFAVGPFGPAAFFISLSRGRVAAGVMQQNPKRSHIWPTKIRIWEGGVSVARNAF